MTEQQAIEVLHALPRLPRSGASLERMQALLDHLGNPEKQFKCIHIAGTNGKGTLAAMTSSILTHAGYKTGLTISPYVVKFLSGAFSDQWTDDVPAHPGQPDSESAGCCRCHHR